VKLLREYIRALIKEKFAHDDFKDVYATARMAHVGQKRRSGEDYFSHPSEVRNIVVKFYPRDRVSQLAALLHDSLEDAPGSTVESEEEMRGFIRGSISNPASADEVIRVVRALTHEKGGDYLSYVTSLVGDEPALRVKLADMVHNLSSNPSPKQRAKYQSAVNALSAQSSGQPPTGISKEHWSALLSLVEGSVTREDMKEIRRYIRELLKESIDPKIMSMIDRAEKKGYKVKVTDYQAIVYDPKFKSSSTPEGEHVAYVSWDDTGDHGPCLSASYVTNSRAYEGMGPLAYDIAIEASGGLMSDRTEVSGEAENVWYHYMKRRPDVQADQLDITKDFGVPQLTPDYKKDDCSQVPAFDLYGSGWDGTGLSQKISKAGTPVIDELRKRGILQE